MDCKFRLFFFFLPLFFHVTNGSLVDDKGLMHGFDHSTFMQETTFYTSVRLALFQM